MDYDNRKLIENCFYSIKAQNTQKLVFTRLRLLNYIILVFCGFILPVNNTYAVRLFYCLIVEAAPATGGFYLKQKLGNILR